MHGRRESLRGTAAIDHRLATAGVREILVRAVEHRDELRAIHEGRGTDESRALVALEDAVIGGRLDDGSKPGACAYIGESSGVIRRLIPEGTNDHGRSFRSVDGGAGTRDAGMHAVAIAVALDPSARACVLKVRVVPSSDCDVIKACRARHCIEETAVHDDDQLGQFGPQCIIAGTEGELRGVQEAFVEK